MADFVSENKCFLNEKEKTLCKRGYYLVRASDRSWKKSQILGNFEGQIRGKIRRFHRNFGANFAKKQLANNGQILWEVSGQISLEINRIFNIRSSFALSKFNNTLHKTVNGKALNIIAIVP